MLTLAAHLPGLRDVLAHLGLPFALGLLIWAVRTYGPAIRKRVPSEALPWIAAALGGAVSLVLRRAGVELPELEGDLGAAIKGVLGVGLAAAGGWSLTAVARKRAAKGPPAEGAGQAPSGASPASS